MQGSGIWLLGDEITKFMKYFDNEKETSTRTRGFEKSA